MAKHICPVCGNDEFYTNAHVVQGWRVDSDGAFIAETENCVEVTHSPDDDDIWTCSRCGWEGAGKEALAKKYCVSFNVAGSIVVNASSAKGAEKVVMNGVRGDDTAILQAISDTLQDHLAHSDISIDDAEEDLRR